MSDISRIEIFCDDRLVQPIKRMLLSMKGIHEVKDQPVINAQAKNGKLRQVSGGTVLEMFVAHARKKKLTTFNSQTGAAFLASIGKSPGSWGYLKKLAVKAGILEKHRGKQLKDTTYSIHLPRSKKGK